MVKTQLSRSQAQNRKLARRFLADKVEQKEMGSKSRVEMKAEIKRKRKASGVKKARRKYRRLEEEGRGDEEEGMGMGKKREGEKIWVGGEEGMGKVGKGTGVRRTEGTRGRISEEEEEK